MGLVASVSRRQSVAKPNFVPRVHGWLACALVAFALCGCGIVADTPEKLTAQAKVALDKGDAKTAIIHLLNAAKAAPDDARVRYLLGMSYKEDGQFAQAVIELRKALTLKYSESEAIPPLGKSLLAMKRFDELLEEVRDESTFDGRTRADILTLRALASLGTHRVDDGRALLSQALAIDPNFADALLGQALLALSDEKVDVAAALVDRAIASSPRNVDAWLMRGDIDRMQKRDSAGAYRKVLELDPKNVLARENLVSMLISEGNDKEARTLIDELHKLAPNSAIALYSEGVIEVRRKNYTAAREWAERALKYAPRHVPSLLLAGTAEIALGHHKRAVPYLMSVVDRVPESLYPRKLLLIALLETGQTLNAREIVSSSLFRAPDDVDLLVQAGEVELQAGDLPSARAYFQRAMNLDPKSASAHTGLAASRLAKGETDRAVADLEAAVALDSRAYRADVLLVLTNLQRARYDEALKAVETLEKKQPSNPLTYNLKGSIYLAEQDLSNARKYFGQALELRPTYLPAAENLAQLYIVDKKPKLARKLLEDILATDEDNVDVLLALAKLAPRMGASAREQEKWLERARAASPGMVRPALILARIYSDAGRPDKALEVLMGAQANERTSFELLDALGGAQLAAGEKQKALATYARLASLQPKSAAVHYRLASAQALNDDPLSAARSLRRALELQPDYYDAKLALVGVEIRNKRYVEATSIARQLQKQDPRSPIGFVLEGDVLMADSKFLAAAKLYEAAYGLTPSGATAMKLHAAYSRGKRPDEAGKRLAQWLEKSPNDTIARRFAADTALKTGQYANAIEQYDRLRQKEPANTEVLNNLAMAYWFAKDPRAVATAEQAYKLQPKDPDVADTLGWLLIQQGDGIRGIDVLQKALMDHPDRPTMGYHLAYGWYRAGNHEKARYELERLLSGDANFPERGDAESLLKQLK